MALMAASTIARLADWMIEDVLTDTCDILRETRVRVPSGGSTITYPVQHTGVPCAVVGGANPQEQFIAGQEVGFILQFILLPKGTDVLGSDRIKVNGAVTYHVIDIDDATYEIVRKVLVRRSSLVG